jgi:hypothetical protein
MFHSGDIFSQITRWDLNVSASIGKGDCFHPQQHLKTIEYGDSREDLIDFSRLEGIVFHKYKRMESVIKAGYNLNCLICQINKTLQEKFHL